MSLVIIQDAVGNGQGSETVEHAIVCGMAFCGSVRRLESKKCGVSSELRFERRPMFSRKVVYRHRNAGRMRVRACRLVVPISHVSADTSWDKIDVKHVYTEVDCAIGSQFIRHALNDFEPIEDLQGNNIARNEAAGEKGEPRENPADQRHLPARFPHEKIWNDPALMGGRHANHSAKVAPGSSSVYRCPTSIDTIFRFLFGSQYRCFHGIATSLTAAKLLRVARAAQAKWQRRPRAPTHQADAEVKLSPQPLTIASRCSLVYFDFGTRHVPGGWPPALCMAVCPAFPRGDMKARSQNRRYYRGANHRQFAPAPASNKSRRLVGRTQMSPVSLPSFLTLDAQVLGTFNSEVSKTDKDGAKSGIQGVGENGRSPKKTRLPARFPPAKIRVLPWRGLNPVLQGDFTNGRLGKGINLDELGSMKSSLCPVHPMSFMCNTDKLAHARTGRAVRFPWHRDLPQVRTPDRRLTRRAACDPRCEVVRALPPRVVVRFESRAGHVRGLASRQTDPLRGLRTGTFSVKQSFARKRTARLPPRGAAFSPRSSHSWVSTSGNRAGRCRWLAGFLGDLPFTLNLHSGAAPFARLISPSSALKTRPAPTVRHWKPTRKEKVNSVNKKTGIANVAVTLSPKNSIGCGESDHTCYKLPSVKTPRTAYGTPRRRDSNRRRGGRQTGDSSRPSRRAAEQNVQERRLSGLLLFSGGFLLRSAHSTFPGDLEADSTVVESLPWGSGSAEVGHRSRESVQMPNDRSYRELEPHRIGRNGVKGVYPNITTLNFFIGGATVTERLDCSPPTKANRWESSRMTPMIGGFSRGSPISPAISFRRCSILTSITLIGSQDLDVESHPNLVTNPLFTVDEADGIIALHKAEEYTTCLNISSTARTLEKGASCTGKRDWGRNRPWPLLGSHSSIRLDSFLDKLDVQHMSTEVSYAIGSQFIRHTLGDSEPIAELQGNKLDPTVLCTNLSMSTLHWLSAVAVEGDGRLGQRCPGGVKHRFDIRLMLYKHARCEL
ncbi:hypothetical protein PR048_033456 [Dryococelus australis]|uniref:Uncharacterized protein n=1 Tax=Dryococelus australis TaxID=614101 RepID=A0ABQ9G3M8_9NEOP|nr:hypothetical protein PR048_033456 [Dryococelus australis]